MRGSCYVFDDEGTIWHCEEDGWRQRIGNDICEGKLRFESVASFGYIEASIIRNAIRVKLCPRVVSQVALAALYYWLADNNFSSGIISVLESDWSDRIIRGRKQFFRMLGDITNGAFSDDKERFLSADLRLEQMEPTSPHGQLYALWEQGALSDAGEVSEICGALFGGRYTITEVVASDRLVIRKTGSGYQTYTASYLEHSCGLRLEDDPDFVYGCWVARAHRKVFASKKPVYQDIDALIRKPGQGVVRVRYRRIILPFSEPDGGEFLVSASIAMPSIDLRIKSA